MGRSHREQDAQRAAKVRQVADDELGRTHRGRPAKVTEAERAEIIDANEHPPRHPGEVDYW